MSTNLLRRTRRSDSTPVLQLTFPEGTDEAGVKEALDNFGLSGYRVENSSGVYTATRSDLQSISEDSTLKIKLSDAGLIATVARAATLETAAKKKCVAMTSIEFDPEAFDEASAQAWLDEKCVDGPMMPSENSTGCYTVKRMDVPDGEETRHIQLDKGVTATIIRADMMNIPANYVAVVSEAAYGCWGWGQLDFTAMMADVEFSEQMREGIDTLESVLREITLYSQLPIDTRKTLVDNALTQFGVYVSTIMDSLPRQLLVSVVRSATTPKENPMSTKDATGGTNPEAKAATPLTRADVESIITEVLARSAAKPADPAPEAKPETKVDVPAAPVSLSRSDVADIVAQAIAPVLEGFTKLAGTTVVRSADEQNPTPPEAKAGAKKDVFRGALSSIMGRAA